MALTRPPSSCVPSAVTVYPLHSSLYRTPCSDGCSIVRGMGSRDRCRDAQSFALDISCRMHCTDHCGIPVTDPCCIEYAMACPIVCGLSRSILCGVPCCIARSIPRPMFRNNLGRLSLRIGSDNDSHQFSPRLTLPCVPG
jgi:hypothetical protein